MCTTLFVACVLEPCRAIATGLGYLLLNDQSHDDAVAVQAQAAASQAELPASKQGYVLCAERSHALQLFILSKTFTASPVAGVPVARAIAC